MDVRALLHPLLPGPRAVPVNSATTTAVGRTELGSRHKLISKVHLSITLPTEGLATITDSSTNGTWLNGVRLRHGHPTVLMTGSIITLLCAESVDFCFVFVQDRPHGAQDKGAENPLANLVKRILTPATVAGGMPDDGVELQRQTNARHDRRMMQSLDAVLNSDGDDEIEGAAGDGSSSCGTHRCSVLSSSTGSHHGYTASHGGSCGRISELLSEVGMGHSPPQSPRDSLIDVNGGEGDLSDLQTLCDGGEDEEALKQQPLPHRDWHTSVRGVQLVSNDDDTAGLPASLATPRLSVLVGRGSASMSCSSIDDRGHNEEVDDRGGGISSPRDSCAAAHPSGLLVPLDALIDMSVNNGRGFAGMLHEGKALELNELLCALTHSCWQGVSSLMALEPSYGAHGDWTPPEYHMLVVSFLCVYKRYVQPDALLTHLTMLYMELGKLDPPQHMLRARAVQTTRERVLYVLVLWARRHPEDFEQQSPRSTSPGGGGMSGGVAVDGGVEQSATAAGRRVSLVAASAGAVPPLRRRLVDFARMALVELMEGTGLEPPPRGAFGCLGVEPPPGDVAQLPATDLALYLVSLNTIVEKHAAVVEAERSRGYDGPAAASLYCARSATAEGLNGWSITQASGEGREFGVDYWRRLLSGPQSTEQSRVRELAYQLAAHESELLRVVKASELQGLAFARAATKHQQAPNVIRLIGHFNRISRWVCTQVVKLPSVKERARCLRLFIELARACRDVGNLNGVMEITAALNSAALHRLRRSWDAVPRAARRDFEDLCTLVSPERSHAALRHATRQAARSGPAVPYLGLYLADLTFVEEGSLDFVEAADGCGERLINLGKCMMLGKCIGEVLTFQTAGFSDVELNESLSLYFAGLDPPGDDEIYALSLAAEPRDGRAGGGGGGSTSCERSAYVGGGSVGGDGDDGGDGGDMRRAGCTGEAAEGAAPCGNGSNRRDEHCSDEVAAVSSYGSESSERSRGYGGKLSALSRFHSQNRTPPVTKRSKAGSMVGALMRSASKS